MCPSCLTSHSASKFGDAEPKPKHRETPEVTREDRQLAESLSSPCSASQSNRWCTQERPSG